MPSAEEILHKHRGRLLAYPFVNGAGIGEEASSDGAVTKYIQVYVTRTVSPEGDKVAQLLPETLDGVEVRVREIGEITVEGATP